LTIDQLHPLEQKGYQAFHNDIKVDELLGGHGLITDVAEFAYLMSGWFIAAREVFAVGALAFLAEKHGDADFVWSNPYPSAEEVEYDCNRNWNGENAWFRINEDILLPRARQWHQGWAWVESQL
jgi:hypothetical protein